MATNKLQTRLALRYDSYENWTKTDKSGQGGNLVLLAGELGICAVQEKTQGAQTAPTVLFKVGDGVSSFKQLSWASALAADVYDWAKAKEIVVTETAVQGSNVKAKALTFKGANNSVIASVNINFVTEAEVKAITSGIQADLAAMSATVTTIEGNVTNITKENGIIDTRISNAISNTVGTVPTGKTLIEVVNEAVVAAKKDITSNAANIAQLTTQAVLLEEKDTDLESRLTRVEAFFGEEPDREDGGYAHISKALDTLVEIQSYLDGEGSNASNLINQVAQNKNDITSINRELQSAKADISSNYSQISSLQELFSTTSTAVNEVKNKAEAAQAAADNIIAYIGTADNGLIKNIHTTVIDNTSRIASVESDYLSKSDTFIFNCGDSTTIISE